MKRRNLFITASLSLLLGLGVAAGVATKANTKPVEKVEAATNSVVLRGSFNDWSTTSDPLILDGDYWTIEKTLAVNDQFKLFVNGSDWVGDGAGVHWCSRGMGSNGTGENFKVLIAGTYRIKAAKTIGDYGDKSYGVYFEIVNKGTLYVDLRESGWSDGAANYAAMFMDKVSNPEIDRWSSYVTGVAAGEHLVAIPYDIDIIPSQMTIVRYNPDKTESQWNSNKWTDVYSQTKDDIFGGLARIGSRDGTKNNVYVGYPKIIGGTGGAWSDIQYLTSVKSNGYRNVEYYTTVTLAAGAEFKIQVAPYNDGDYYGDYTTYSSISSNFSGGGSSNIKVVNAGTYTFYYDYFATYTGSKRIYITTPAAASADEWSEYFLDNVGCDSSGVNIPTGWSLCATEYGKLSNDAKDIVYGASANPSGSYVEQAVARYDQAIRSHPSLNHFIVNSSSTPRSAGTPIRIHIFGNSGDDMSGILIISIVSIISVSAVGGYFFLRKKKEK